MAKVSDLHQREADTVTAELVRRLPVEGAVTVRLDRLPLPVDSWRKAARAAGRQLQRPIRTGISPTGIVWAALDDWPKHLPETRASEKQLREAILSLPDLAT